MPRDQFEDGSDVLKDSGDVLTGSSDAFGPALFDPNYPSPANTGIPAGTTLTSSGTVIIETPGQVVDALDITGSIYINAINVTVKRTRISLADGNLLEVAPTATGAIVEDCEFSGQGTNGGTGILLRASAMCRRLNIHGIENGFHVYVNAGTIRDSYLHDMYTAGGAHTDGMEFDPDASNLLIEHNYIYPAPSGSTSCINIYNEVGGTNNNITVNNNKLDAHGCSFAIYFPRFAGWSNIVATNNRLVRGITGYCDSSVNTTTFTGNVDDITGAAIPTGV